jgi:hypothetical protein
MRNELRGGGMQHGPTRRKAHQPGVAARKQFIEQQHPPEILHRLALHGGESVAHIAIHDPGETTRVEPELWADGDFDDAVQIVAPLHQRVFASALDNGPQIIASHHEIRPRGPVLEHLYLSPKFTRVKGCPMFRSIIPHSSS